MLQTAIILAGGFGTRLQSVVSDLPKPMAAVAGRPFLDYQLAYLKQQGIQTVIISTGHLAEKITEHFGTDFNGIKIIYSHENTALGTGGGIRLAMEKTKDQTVLVLNGDSFFDLPIPSFFEAHHKSAAACSLALRQVDNAARYGAVETNAQQNIISFKEKSHNTSAGLINGGVYLLDRAVYLSHTKAEQNFSIEKDFFQTLVSQIKIKGFLFNNYFIDIGIPEDFHQAQNDFKGFKY